MAAASQNSPKSLIGASIPRSGHHFLQNLLSTYYGEDMYYCEFYSPADCCKTFPCTRRGRHTITYQKSHDREQEVPTDQRGSFYIIQYRHPVSEAVSDRELDLDDGLGRRSVNYRMSRDHYMSWLAQKAVYYRKFHDKWMRERVPNGVYSDYAVLAQDPRAILKPIVEWASGVDDAKIDEVIEKVAGQRVSTPQSGAAAKVFKPRVPEDSPNFDADLLGAFEDYVLKRCPAFGFERTLKGSFEGHPLHGLILMDDPTEPLPAGETRRFPTAMKLTPNHPELLLRAAAREGREGKIDKAIASLEAIIRQSPYFTPAYRMLFSVSKKAGKPVKAELFDGNSILGVSENPELLVDVAAAFLSREHIVNAVIALSLALILAPEHARANHLMAAALANEHKWAQAEPFATKAQRLEPSNNANEKLLQKIRRKMA